MIGAKRLLDAVTAHAQTSGDFENALPRESTRVPGQGLTAEFWYARLGFAPARSGLNSTTSRVEITCRISRPVTTDQAIDVEGSLLDAVDGLVASYSGDFELPDIDAEIDLLGAYGNGLTAEGGYLTRDGQVCRCYVLTIPVIINDLWSQGVRA